MKLPLSLEYKLDADARRAQIKLSGGKPDSSWFHYVNTPGTRFMLACFVAWFGSAIFSRMHYGGLVCVIAFIFWCRWIFLCGSAEKRRVTSWLHQTQDEPLRLEIRDDGFRENDCGIESFAPWSAMKFFAVQGKLVQVGLANGLNAYIPTSVLEGAGTSVAELRELLGGHGVKVRET